MFGSNVLTFFRSGKPVKYLCKSLCTYLTIQTLSIISQWSQPRVWNPFFWAELSQHRFGGPHIPRVSSSILVRFLCGRGRVEAASPTIRTASRHRLPFPSPGGAKNCTDSGYPPAEGAITCPSIRYFDIRSQPPTWCQPTRASTFRPKARRSLRG
mmetsp:Transcript_83801/g.245715  ORF Transcript_83801/g.245715 Transcript_83801/m.245715 type:complete len:155 (+) Transcript_83801:57-521(+)